MAHRSVDEGLRQTASPVCGDFRPEFLLEVALKVVRVALRLHVDGAVVPGPRGGGSGEGAADGLRRRGARGVDDRGA